MLSKLITGAAFVFAGSSAVLADSACNYAANKLCVETTDAGVPITCEDGTAAEKCTTEARFATCFIKSFEAYVRFYQGYAGDAVAECADAGGTYTPD